MSETVAAVVPYNCNVPYNFKSAKSKWTKEEPEKKPRKRRPWKDEDEDQVDERGLPMGPASFSTDTDGFWEQFDEYIDAMEFETDLRIFEAQCDAEDGLKKSSPSGETDLGFAFLRSMGNVPDWAQDFCPCHDLIKTDEPADDNDMFTYECKTCQLREKA